MRLLRCGRRKLCERPQHQRQHNVLWDYGVSGYGRCSREPSWKTSVTAARDATDEEVVPQQQKPQEPAASSRPARAAMQMELNEDAGDMCRPGQKQLLTIARAILADDKILENPRRGDLIRRHKNRNRNAKAMDNLMEEGGESFVTGCPRFVMQI